LPMNRRSSSPARRGRSARRQSFSSTARYGTHWVQANSSASRERQRCRSVSS
jgi:hypothetical protein